ncbi:MAG: preprotein translocase subunit SecG [Legionellales bacterium]|nr:preprotein translocase subunit SecG [Legionellales bacterium]|tara:strand:- start:92 stop:406 length:315 start_codon:yes stop_codon:yes gene_type:complete
MLNILFFIHVVVCFALIGLVLIQRGKGSDIGAAFGSGASNTVFGSAGANDFLSKVTAYLAVAFFALSLSMTYLTHAHLKASGVLGTTSLSDGVENDSSLPVIPE